MLIASIVDAHLWRSYKKEVHAETVSAYNDSLRMLLKVPRLCSASEMFVNCCVSCAAVYLFFHVQIKEMTKWYHSALVCPDISAVRFNVETLVILPHCLMHMYVLFLFIIYYCRGAQYTRKSG